MKTIVIYNSKTGFTKRYAMWIAKATEANCLTLSAAKRTTIDTYETIIFGSFACAGRISKLNWFKNNMNKWADKKLIVFCVGGSPINNPEIEFFLKQNFKDSELKKVSVFYCPGGFNYEKMSALARLMMKIFIKTLQDKKDKTEAEQEMVHMISASYDISDKKYIEPILKCLEK